MSDSLRELDKIIEQNREFFPGGNQGKEAQEAEKKWFDEKIGKGRFAYLVKRQEFYEQLIQSLELNSQRMKNSFDQNFQKLQTVLPSQINVSNQIQDKLSQIVKQSTDVEMVDLDSIEADFPSYKLLPQPSQTQTVLSQSVTNLHLQNQIMSHNLASSHAPIESNSQPQLLELAISKQVSAIDKVQSQQNPKSVGLSQHSAAVSPIYARAPSPQQQILSQNSILPSKSFIEVLQQQQPQSAPMSPLLQRLSTQQSFEKQELNAQTDVIEQNDINDDVVIVSEQLIPIVKTQAPCYKSIKYTDGLELEQPAFFKLKAMSLLKLFPGKGWAKVAAVNLFLAKCAQMPDQSVFIIGGSNDQKSTETVNAVTKYKIQSGGKVIMTEMCPMIISRSSFGCTINVHSNEIFVAGGFTHGVTTRKCEAYSVATNIWRELPLLNEEKCASSLCFLNGRYLYCIGGYSKADSSGAYLLSTIEMLDLWHAYPKWNTLAIKLPQQMCDMGSVPLNDHSILLFGGWLKTASQTAFILQIQQSQNSIPSHTFVHVKHGLEKPDFFMITGVAMKCADEPHKFKVCGHAQLFTFNTRDNAFEGSSNM